MSDADHRPRRAGQVVPEHLRPSVDLLHRAFPRGLPGQDRRALLAVLYESFSDRNLAVVVAAFLGADPIVVANEAAGLDRDRPAAADVTRVRDILLAAGWDPDED